MNRFRNFIRNERVNNILLIVKAIITFFSLYLYLVYADLSTAPDFIYNQF